MKKQKDYLKKKTKMKRKKSKSKTQEDNIDTENNNIKDNNYYEDFIENYKNYSTPKYISSCEVLTSDSFYEMNSDNSFIVFKSVDNFLYLVYLNKENSFISFDLINNKKINEIKKPHNKDITSFKYYLDKQNKRDLIMSLCSDEDNIKIWNAYNWECLYNIKNIYNKTGILSCACLLKIDNEEHIVISTYSDMHLIKVINNIGENIKFIKDSKDYSFCITSHYDKKLDKYYIITGNEGYTKSYDYEKNEFYLKYSEKNSSQIDFDRILIKSNEKTTEIIIFIQDNYYIKYFRDMVESMDFVYGMINILLPHAIK